MFRPGATSVDTIISFLAFLLLEVAIGMYFPAISYLRSQVIPESHRANVMNWFRYVWPGYKLSIAILSSEFP